MNISFELRLKEMASGVLKGFQNVTRGVFIDVDKRVADTQRGLSGLGKGVKMEVDSSSVKQAQEEVMKLKRGMNELPGGSRGGGGRGIAGGVFLGGMAQQGVMMAARATDEAVRTAMEKGMDAEQSIIGLATFVGKRRAEGIYKALQKQAVLTPFTTTDMLPVEMGLVATGMKPERANKDMMNLMNAVSATGNAGNSFMFQLMGSHMAQAASAGNIDGLLLREFQRTAHIPVTRLLANDMFPKLSPEAGMKRVKDLDSITYDQFASALDRAAKAGGMFAGALEAQSQTIRGKKSTILDYLGIGEAGAILNPNMHANIIKMEDRIIEGLKDFPKLMDDMQPVFSKLFDTFNEIIPSVKDFGSAILGILKPMGGLVLSDGVKHLFESSLETLANILNTSIIPAFKIMAPFVSATADSLAYWIDLLGMGKTKHGVNANKFDPSPQATYVWSDTLGFGKRGVVADTARMRVMADSINNHQFGGGRFFRDYNDVDNFNRSQPTLATQISRFTNLMTPVTKASAAMASAANVGNKVADGASTADASDAIVGGGKRVVNINYNAPLYKVEHQTFQSIKDAIADFEPKVKEAMLRILYSVPGYN